MLTVQRGYLLDKEHLFGSGGLLGHLQYFLEENSWYKFHLKYDNMCS